MHLDEILTEAAARFPDRPAVSCGGRDFTYRELDKRVNLAASNFRGLGLVPGDRLAYQLHNSRIEAIVTLFAALRAGLIVVPIPNRQGAAQIAYCLRQCAARAFVTEEEFFQRLTTEQLAGVEWTIIAGPPIAGTVSFDALPGDAHQELPKGFPGEDAIGLILYTSGTTSRPKGVAHSQMRLRVRVDLFVEEMGFTEEDATVATAEIGRPIVLVGQVLAMMAVGGRLSLPRIGNAEAFWNAYMAQGNTSYVVTRPGLLPEALEHPGARQASHAALRYWICGGDRVLPWLHRSVREVTGKPVFEMCGMTEAGFYAITPPHDEIRPGSVGKLMFGVQARIVDEEGGEVPTGTVGEIMVRTPNTMIGYWNDTLGTFRVFMDRWIRSGDLARFDTDGYLWIVGRAKLMISRGGAKVAPPMVEDAIREHPSIQEAVVVAQSDPIQGQVPFAFYELRAGMADPGAAVLREWLRPRLDTLSIPDTFMRIDDWPMTAQGKVDRPRLTWIAESGGEGL